MVVLRRFVQGIWALFRKEQLREDLDDELGSFIEAAAEQKMRSGASLEEALRAAKAEVGSGSALQDQVHEAGWESVFERTWQDVRYGLRQLRRSPGFSTVAVVTLAVGIGATTAIFSVVDATLLHPLPYAHPEQLVKIEDDLPGLGAHDAGMSPPEWQDLEHSGIFEYVSPAQFDENNLTGSSRPCRVRLQIVAPNYFALLGVKPQLGRSFNPQDHSPGLLPEVVISDGLWKRQFGGDPHILGKNVRLDTDLYQIVGVMPAGFDHPSRSPEERKIEAWVPTSFYGAPMPDHPLRSRRSLPGAVARLKAGLTIAEAQRRLDAVVASLQKQFPGDYPAEAGWTVRLVPLQQSVVGNIHTALIFLLGAVGLLLLIACVNVANLLLARASGRAREMAIRQALGAARTRLTRQLLAESLLISLLGGVSGLAILVLMKGFLLRILPEDLPRLNEIAINWDVFVFALTASLVAGVIFGLVPALQAGRRDVVPVLKLETPSATGSGEQARTRRGLVVTEIALSLVLMVAATLLLRSFRDLMHGKLGFNPQNVMSVRTRLPYPNDPNADIYRTAGQQAHFMREAVRRARALPGVEEAAMGDTASIPLDQTQRELKLISEGHFFLTLQDREEQNNQSIAAERSSVTPEYFHLVQIPLLRGRLFCNADTDQTPRVAVINEAFAQAYWPNQDPVGKSFRETKASSSWVTVIGVIANARTESLAEENVPKLYLDLYQTGAKRLAIFLRGNFDLAAIPDQTRAQVQAVDPTLPVFDAQTFKQTMADSLVQRRFAMEMMALFALTALFLSAIGIFGVISYVVSERTREIGIRLVLGATSRSILVAILRQGLTLALAGSAIGVCGALIVARAMTGVLYGVGPGDPATFLAVVVLLIAVALLACYVPARRAVRIDPMVALRNE